jgi:hypothetical protein
MQIINRNHPDPLQTDMIMHTNFCTVRGSNTRPLAQWTTNRTTAPNRSLVVCER